MSRDRKLGVTVSEDNAGIDTEADTLSDAQQEHQMKEATKQKDAQQHNPEELEIDSDPSDAEDIEVPEGSLFDYNIPGILTKEEVRKLDLDHWKLFVRNMLVDFEDLRGWEDQSIDDEQSIKSIVGELAATIGPNLLSNSAVQLF